MGLDINAFRRITKIDAVFDADGAPIDPTTSEPVDYSFQACINPDFTGHAEGIEDNAVYDAEETMHFRAGSYGGYSTWRNELAKIAGYPAGTYKQYGQDYESHCVACWDGAQGPFAELINFSDCEGLIGAKVATKLAADFAEFDEKAKAHTGGVWEDRFYPKYQEWRTAFEMASDGGAVQFT